MDRVNAFRDRHGILVVEDAAHALGASWGGAHDRRHGNLTAFSFYVTKNITTGEGGALATDDAEVAAEVERLAMHGLNAGAWQRYTDAGFAHYEVERPGHKHNMTDVQAALGIHQLPRLDAWIERRAEIWPLRRAARRPSARAAARRREPEARATRATSIAWRSLRARVTRDELLDAPRRARHRRRGALPRRAPAPRTTRAASGWRRRICPSRTTCPSAR